MSQQQRKMKILSVLIQGDRQRGMTALEIGEATRITAPYLELTSLQVSGAVEFRFEGDSWPSEGGTRKPRTPGVPRPSYYRPTEKGRGVYAAWYATQPRRSPGWTPSPQTES